MTKCQGYIRMISLGKEINEPEFWAWGRMRKARLPALTLYQVLAMLPEPGGQQALWFAYRTTVRQLFLLDLTNPI